MHPKDYDRIENESKEKEFQKQLDEIDLKDENNLSDNSVENALLNFLIKERIAVSMVDSVNLRKLIRGILAQNLFYC